MNKIILSSIITLFTLGLNAQDVETLISKYTQENGKKFLMPMADCIGANFNSGLFHSAMIKKMGFQMYIGIATTTAFIPEKRKTFMAVPEGFFEPKTPVKVPTIFGMSENVIVNGVGGTQYVFPGGLNMKYLPLAMPQLTIGSVYGTDLTVRFFTYNFDDEDIGKLNLLGFGLRHSISQYFQNMPVDLAAGAYWQQFAIGDIVSASNLLFNVQTSYRVSIFTFYGALGYEKSLLDIDYTYTDTEGDTNVKFNMQGSNSVRFTGGLTFNLGPVKLIADYNLASQSVLSLGFGIGIGDNINNKQQTPEQ